MSALPPDLAALDVESLFSPLNPASKALRTADLGPLIADGQAGTIFATLNGAPVAVVSLDLYRRLVSAAVATSAPAAIPKRSAPKAVRTSTIDRDPEVAAFLRERFRLHSTVVELHATCLDRFGAARTPSQGRIKTLRLRS